MMDPNKAKANYSRVCQLLVDKGGDVLRTTLHAKCLPSTLAAVLNANKKKLQKIRHSVIKRSQWNLLFPVSGVPDSNNFDITLLTILLRNICGLFSPATGWDVMPPASDTSTSADILRIKIFRNEVYGHIPTAQYDDTTFETLWQEISKPLIKLGIRHQDIDALKDAPLSPEEESYIEKLKEWKEQGDDILSKLNNLERGVLKVENEVLKIRKIVENPVPSPADQLAKFVFTGEIDCLCKKFQDGTREWFFDKLSSWFDDEESRVMILTAGPGIGKSVLSAKVCVLYKQRGQLAANHFCNFRNSDYGNPHRILQSLASQMCDNVDGFREKLTEVLRREHSRDSLSDAFRVLLNDPLHALDSPEPVLIVVDALDESKTDDKSDFLELISREFPKLPECIKIFITSRPELQVQNKLQHLNPVEILPDDHHHNLDLEHFILHCLPNLNSGKVRLLISKCEGSFLYAYLLVNELKEMDLGIEPNLSDYVPKGISRFYEEQFKRLKTDLQRLKQDTKSSIFNSFVNVISASTEPLPTKFLFACMGLSGKEFEIREAIFGIMSEILPVYEGCLTVYHKSLYDWLRLDGYEEHAFKADVADGDERLWRSCKNIYSDINSLSSVSDFEISSEKRYALKCGGKHLLEVGDTEDFQCLVNVRVNFLKLKFFGHLNVDFSRILRIYKSQPPDRIFWEIIQLDAILRNISGIPYLKNKEKSYIYLQSLANGQFDVVQTNNNYKNEARDILDTTNEVWMEEVRNECNSKFKIIAHATFEIGKVENQFLDVMSVALSRDNKLLACRMKSTLKVFKLPSLTIICQLELFRSEFLIFSPDSSYLLTNSVERCISIREQKEIPFIPHGPEYIDCCSFSSCGTRLVTLKESFIQVWDVITKDLLVEDENVIGAKYCWFSNSNSSIFAADWDRFSCHKFALFDSITLAKKEGDICVDTCLTYEDNFQMISPSPKDSTNTNIRIDHFHFPTAETLLIANRYCSKPFKWRNRKCVIFSNSPKSASPLVVYDFINKEIIDMFHINCFSSCSRITYISNLDETNFLICFNYGHIFLLSFETSTESSRTSFVSNADMKCCALSPDNFYIVCCYENSILTIRSVDNGETLQTVELKQPPEACWWSKLCLWVVCEGVVVKYPYDSTQRKVLGNELEECPVNFDTVFKFAEGVLVIKYDRKISILKICNEKLCPQQIIPNLEFPCSSAAISSDGCAVLLYRYSQFTLDFELLEIACENRCESRSTVRCPCSGDVQWLCLNGTKNSRSSFFLRSPKGGGPRDICLSSVDFSNTHQMLTWGEHPFKYRVKGAIYVDSNSLIVHDVHYGVHFIKVSDWEISTSLSLVGFQSSIWEHVSPFYIASRSLLLLVGQTDIKFLKIHNIENYLL